MYASLVFSIFASASPAAATTTATTTVLVEGPRPVEHTTPTRVIRSLDGASDAPAADAAEALRGLPGVTAGRFGGHGLEPVVRGRQQNQLNVVSDGVAHMGGCMNRMDPPTAYTAIETFDAVVVDRGYQSVLDGPGGSGGTIHFERAAPDLRARAARAKLGVGMESNGGMGLVFGDVAAGSSDASLRLLGSYKHAGSYSDGGGTEVRSSFEDYDVGLLGAWQASERWKLDASVERREIFDALYAGALMDGPLSRSHALKLAAAGVELSEHVRSVEASAFGSFVVHTMDNYSLRPNPEGAPNLAVGDPPHRRVDSDSTVVGARVLAKLDLGVPLELVVDGTRTARDATRFQGTTAASTTMSQSLMWPELSTTSVGLGAQTTLALGPSRRLTAGARYDLVLAAHGRADEKTQLAAMRSPNDLYLRYYGVRAEDATEHNVGGLLRFEQDVGAWLKVGAKVSRSVRSADATERGLASDGGAMLGMSWVGDPAISPEAHHELELDVALASPRDGPTRRSRFGVNVAAWVDYVDDFILRDKARGQSGILQADGADIYRNVGARLLGAEADARVELLEHLELVAAIAFTHGENTEDHRALAQIPPVDGQLSAEWRTSTWSLGSRVHFAGPQDRVDDDPTLGSGVDAGPTDAYALLDVYGSVSLASPLRMEAGVSNLLDETYALHLNRATLFDPSALRVLEPGRSLWVRIRAEL